MFTAEVAAKLGVNRFKLEHMIANNQIPTPEVRCGRRIWTTEQVRKAAEVLERRRR